MILFFLTWALGGALISLYIFYKKRFQFWDNQKGFPHTDPVFLWGDASGIARTRQIGEIVNSVYKAFSEERFVGLWLLFKPNVLIRDPELVKNILVKEFMTFHDRGIFVNEKNDPLSAHLFSIGGSKWRNTRVKLTPTFTSGKLKMMFPILVECSKRFRDILAEPAKQEQTIEVKNYAARFTTDIISLAAFGLDTDSLNNPNAEFRHHGKLLFEPNFFESISQMIIFMVPSVGELFNLRPFRKESTEFFLNAFQESFEYRENNNIKRNDFLDLLIQLKNKGKLEDAEGDGSTKFTFLEAAAQAFAFFIAGFETSSTTIQFALYELAKNPEIQEEARKEIKRVLAKHNNEITYDSVSEMEYLGRVIDETLRMHPAVPLLQRECNKDWKIPDSNLMIPKGITALIDCIGLHHDPLHYPEPEKFDPERFTEEGKASRHHYAYLPFGEGPRNCIGMRFGLMQTRVGLLTLLTNYKFSTVKETPIPMILEPKSFILTPKGGMHIRITNV